MTSGLFDVLERHRVERPRAIALVDEAASISYAELPHQIDTRRRLLTDRSCRVAALNLDNGVQWVLWDLAAAAAGVACVPVPPFFTDAQRRHVYTSAGVDCVIGPRGVEENANAAVDLPAGTAKITFTSGTTGTPKGVCLSFDGMLQVANSILGALTGKHPKRHFSALPLAVLLENVAGVYPALIAGSRIILAERAQNWTDPRALLTSLAESEAQSVILVPELLRGLVDIMERTGAKLPHLAFAAVGGSRVSPELIGRARRAGLPVYEGYGLSECGSVVSLNTPSADRAGSVGRVLPHVDLKIDNGEIVVTNPVGLGYLGGEEARGLRTGDLGALSKDGFLEITGRIKNVLITGYGRNISPEWLESELLAQPSIGQAVVYGDGWTQPGAVISSPSDIHDRDIEKAVELVNASLPDYARLGGWIRVAPFTPHSGTLTGSGRPRRAAIAEYYLNELERKLKQPDFFERLVKATEQARNELYAVPQLVEGLGGRISRATYVAYLTEAYHHVRHTVPFLMAMGSRLDNDHQWLQEAVIDYINEEKGHEQWILTDIESAGGNRSAVTSGTPRLETQVLVAYNYDYIHRKNPVGFLGMVFMLESTSTQIATRGASAIQGALNLPDTAFSYLYSHGALDQEHMKFFRALVNRVTDEGDQAAIIEVATNTFRLFANVLRAIPHDTEIKHVA